MDRRRPGCKCNLTALELYGCSCANGLIAEMREEAQAVPNTIPIINWVEQLIAEGGLHRKDSAKMLASLTQLRSEISKICSELEAAIYLGKTGHASQTKAFPAAALRYGSTIQPTGLINGLRPR